jgi:GNAT superfamily N-acetyltransferase
MNLICNKPVMHNPSTDMIFREAVSADIPRIQVIRNAVRENRLSDPALVTDGDVLDYITHRGRGWVCEVGDQLMGFAIADLQDHNIWALFIHPDFEQKGIGKELHRLMLDWYFSQTTDPVWLSTSPGTRAERFYRKAGWEEKGLYGKGEIKFEMTQTRWTGQV